VCVRASACTEFCALWQWGHGSITVFQTRRWISSRLRTIRKSPIERTNKMEPCSSAIYYSNVWHTFLVAGRCGRSGQQPKTYVNGSKFIYGLFKDAVWSSYITASNVLLINKLWIVRDVRGSDSIPVWCTNEQFAWIVVRKAKQNFSQDDRYREPDLNLEPPK